MKNLHIITLLLLISMVSCISQNQRIELSGNPILPGWYADPEGAMFEDKYWIYPTKSCPYTEGVSFDCFSSTDLINWEKHTNILDTAEVKWAWQTMWAPAIIENEGKYYYFFSANDIQSDNEPGGIGVAVSDHPQGPFKDLLGKPLIDKFHNGAQPIDQFVYKDEDGTFYMYYGGWGHCNVVKLSPDFTGLIPFEDGSIYKEITPTDYVEGPFMFKKDGKYYFMWSEGSWTGPTYRVAYSISDSPLGPFNRIGTILEQDPEIATGAGHHSVIINNSDYYILYHRRPLNETNQFYRITCIDKMTFNENGYINPVRMTFEGVKANPLK